MPANTSLRFEDPTQTTEPELWMQLCAQAAKEQDPQKLLSLIEKINSLLEEEQSHPKDPLPVRRARD